MMHLKGLEGTVSGYADEELTRPSTVDSGLVIGEDVIDGRHFVVVEDDSKPAENPYRRFKRTILWGDVSGSKVITVAMVLGQRHVKVEDGSTPRIQGLADALRERLAENGPIDVSGLCNRDVIELARAEQLI